MENVLSQQRCSCGVNRCSCWCMDCCEALCDACMAAHRRVTLTKSHRILDQPPGNLRYCVATYCSLHPGERLQLYCFTCGQFTCKDCQLSSHANHSYQFIGEAVVEVKRQLKDLVEGIRVQTDTIDRTLQSLNSRLADMNEGDKKLRYELRNAHDLCVNILTKRMDLLLERVMRSQLLESTSLQSNMKRLNDLKTKQLSVTEALERAQFSDNLSLLLQLQAKVGKHMAVLMNQDLAPPKVMAEMEVVTNLDAINSLSNFGDISVKRVPFRVSKTSDQNSHTTSIDQSVPHTGTTSGSTCVDTRTQLTASSQFHLSHSSSAVPFPSNDSPSSNITSHPLRTTTSFTSIQPVLVSHPASLLPSYIPPGRPPPYPNLNSAPLVTNIGNFGTRVTYASTTGPFGVTNENQVVLLQPSTSVVSPSNRNVVPLTTPSMVSRQNPCMALTIPEIRQQVPNSCKILQETEYNPYKPKTLPINTATQPDLRVQISSPAVSSIENPVRLSNPRPPSQPTSTAGATVTVNSTAEDGRPPSFSVKQKQNVVVRAVADSVCDGGAVKLREQPVNIPTYLASEDAELSHNAPTSTMSKEPAENGSELTVSEEPAENELKGTVCKEPAENGPEVIVSIKTKPLGEPCPAPTAEEDAEEFRIVIGQQGVQDQSMSPRSKLPRTLLRHGRPLTRTKRRAPTNNTSSLLQESEPSEQPSTSITIDRTAAKHWSLIGRNLTQWQPRVTLYRLPRSLANIERPLPLFSPDSEDEEGDSGEAEENFQLDDDGVSEDSCDFTKPLSSPESPLSPQTPPCSVCGSSDCSVSCASCGRTYHPHCHVPPASHQTWTDWKCSLCQDLSDPSDPYSCDRRDGQQEDGLSMLDQRRCETLLLHLLVESCDRLSQDSCVRSRLMLISQRLTQRGSPPYQTSAEFLFDMWSVLRAESEDDDAVKDLQRVFHIRSMETFSSEHNRTHSVKRHVVEEEEQQEVNTAAAPKQEATKLNETRKRLRALMDLNAVPAAKRFQVE